MSFGGPVAPDNKSVIETLRLYEKNEDEVVDKFELILMLMYMDIEKALSSNKEYIEDKEEPRGDKDGRRPYSAKHRLKN